MMGPICELCYRTAPLLQNGDVPEEWRLVMQSWICPSCRLEAQVEQRPLVDCPGGCFAPEGVKDPREAPLGGELAWERVEVALYLDGEWRPAGTLRVPVKWPA